MFKTHIGNDLYGKCGNTLYPKFTKKKWVGNKWKSRFFDFYAGYSTSFVADVLLYWNLPGNSVILDPWNGSGTTTDIASKMGYKAIGYDLNPWNCRSRLFK